MIFMSKKKNLLSSVKVTINIMEGGAFHLVQYLRKHLMGMCFF